jgi:hypothetical protein
MTNRVASRRTRPTARMAQCLDQAGDSTPFRQWLMTPDQIDTLG